MHKSNFNLLTYELTSHVFAPFYRIIAVGQPQIHDPSSGQAVYKESCCVHAFLAMDPLSMCWRNIYMSYTVDVDWRRPTSTLAILSPKHYNIWCSRFLQFGAIDLPLGP